MKSIIQDEKKCYLCHTVVGLDEHHLIEGRFKRLSEDYGLKIFLCRKCHRIVQTSEKEMQKLRVLAQKKAMEHYKWTENDFRFVFGRSFL